MHAPSVTPAKAGVQAPATEWIPASAGMTETARDRVDSGFRRNDGPPHAPRVTTSVAAATFRGPYTRDRMDSGFRRNDGNGTRLLGFRLAPE